MGVDSENPSNEVVSPVVRCKKKVTITFDTEEVVTKASAGIEKKLYCTIECDKKTIVHYEVGYVAILHHSEYKDFAMYTLTALCGTVGGPITH